jgi:hypothetical protein
VCAAGEARANNHRDAARKVRHQEAVDDPVARTGEESWAGAVSLTGAAMRARPPECRGPRP